MTEHGTTKPNSLQFLIETAASRGPGKRQVKVRPQADMEDVVMLAADEEDDTDFQCSDNGSNESGSESSGSSENDSETGSDTKEQSPEGDSDMEGGVDPCLDASGLICGLCMNMREGDEILQCDRCTIAVHESCYGLTDTDSVHSDNSSSTTEPWFCEPCVFGVESPQDLACELCPVVGGLSKRTDSGSWVHLLCALYTPNVTFGDAETLRCISLFEMGYQNFGARKCYICSDKLLSRTGVCVKCDAGMCKTYAHVMCAFEQGLLTDASYTEMNTCHSTADPRYILCKQHVDQDFMRRKKQRFRILKAQLDEMNRRGLKILTEREERALARQRDHLTFKIKTLSNWFPRDQKWPRALSTSARMVKSMQRKGEFVGMSRDMFRKQFHPPVSMEMIGRTTVRPAFGPEFILYYREREDTLIPELKREKHKLEMVCQNLRNQQVEAESKLSTDDQLHNLLTHLKFLGAKNVKLNEVCSKGRKPMPKSQRVGISLDICATCHKKHNQHVMALCDTCHKHFHLACLDPPLFKMPKKTAMFGWECSNCFRGSSSDSQSEKEDSPEEHSAKRKRRSMPVTRTSLRVTAGRSPEKAKDVKMEVEATETPDTTRKKGGLSKFSVKPEDIFEDDDDRDDYAMPEEYDDDEDVQLSPPSKYRSKAVAPICTGGKRGKKKTSHDLSRDDSDGDDTLTKNGAIRRRKFSPRAQYSDKTLSDAIDSVLEGRMTTINACAYFKVPRSTLFRLVSARRNKRPNKSQPSPDRVIPQSHLIEEEVAQDDFEYDYIVREEEVE